MTSTTLLGFALGAGLAGSLLLLAAAVTGWRPRRTEAPSRGQGRWADRLGPNLGNRVAIAVAVGIPVAVLTRWPVMVGAAVVLVLVWPQMFGASRASGQQMARLEAVATWTESMRDTIAGSIALEEAIRNTAGAAPDIIQESLQRLVVSLSVHVPLPQALSQFAEDFQDESIDLVAAALILNSRLRGPGLVATLTALASTTREELDMRRRIEEERKNLRRDARTIMVTAIGFAGVLAIFSRSYMAPYSTAAGQVVLAVVVAIFMTGLVWMRRLANIRGHERFLVGPETLARRAGSTDQTGVST